MRVVISAGHGGKHLGAKSLDGEFIEKHLNLNTSQKVIQHLKGIPWIHAALIRSWDETISRKERRARTASFGADVVVEIHYDSLPSNKRAHGLRCYHKHNDTRMAAVATAIVTHAPPPLRLQRGGVIDAFDDKSRTDDDWLTRPQTVVEGFPQDTVLVECCFLSNETDLAFLRTPNSLDLIANAIVAGLLTYSQQKGTQS